MLGQSLIKCLRSGQFGAQEQTAEALWILAAAPQHDMNAIFAAEALPSIINCWEGWEPCFYEEVGGLSPEEDEDAK